MPREILIPEKCRDGCIFCQSFKGLLFNCKLYNGSGNSATKDKLDECKAEKIVVYEKNN